jgi:autotransporter adhesin
VGSATSQRTITNVAAGQISQTSTDAINGSQLYATNQAVDSLATSVANGLTHYYSANDGGAQQANYNNDGATAANALAVGVAASSTQTGATAVGSGAQATIADSVALGSNAVSDRPLAPTSGTIGGTFITYNTTDRTLLGAVSVGSATTYRQITNVADGTQSNDAVTVRQLTGALSSFATTTTKYFHANSTDPDSLAVGNNAIAVGPNTVADGDNGVGIGNGAQVAQNAPGGVAIGENAASNLQDSIALGTNATANGIQAISIGAGASTANPTNVALGAGANAAAQAGDVALGANSKTSAVVATSSVTVGGNTYAVAGDAPTSTVSVGAAGAERTVTNVAAGQVSATSTDAVNGSELYATNQQVNANTSAINNLDNTVTNITNGGAGNKYYSVDSTGNAAAATGSNAVSEGPSSTASGTNSVAVGDGASSSGNNSVALGAGSNDGGESNVVSVGSSTQQRRITNVAPGTAPTDAATVGQVDAGVQTAENWAQNYTDQQLNNFNRNLNTVASRANAGVASAMAMAGLPQAYQPNQSGAAVALGSFHGEAGIAIGVSTVTESGRWVYKLNFSDNTRGDAGVAVGAAVMW